MTFVTGEDGKVDAVQLGYMGEKEMFKKQTPFEEDIKGQALFGEDQTQFRM